MAMVDTDADRELELAGKALEAFDAPMAVGHLSAAIRALTAAGVRRQEALLWMTLRNAFAGRCPQPSSDKFRTAARFRSEPYNLASRQSDGCVGVAVSAMLPACRRNAADKGPCRIKSAMLAMGIGVIAPSARHPFRECWDRQRFAV
jgi:hypothetical protein